MREILHDYLNTTKSGRKQWWMDDWRRQSRTCRYWWELEGFRMFELLIMQTTLMMTQQPKRRSLCVVSRRRWKNATDFSKLKMRLINNYDRIESEEKLDEESSGKLFIWKLQRRRTFRDETWKRKQFFVVFRKNYFDCYKRGKRRLRRDY